MTLAPLLWLAMAVQTVVEDPPHPVPAYNDVVRLRWDANPIEDQVTSYYARWGEESGRWTTGTTVWEGEPPPTGARVTGSRVEGIASHRPTFWVIVARSRGLESIPSEEVIYRPRDRSIHPPTALRVLSLPSVGGVN